MAMPYLNILHRALDQLAPRPAEPHRLIETGITELSQNHHRNGDSRLITQDRSQRSSLSTNADRAFVLRGFGSREAVIECLV